MIKIMIAVIVSILLIWIVMEYVKWKKQNETEEELKRSGEYEAVLRKRAKTLKTNIKNVGVAKALDDIEEDLDDGDIDLDTIYEEVDRFVQPDSFK